MLVFQGESAAVDLCFTRDNARLLTVDGASNVDVWDLASGTHTRLLGARNVDEARRYEPPEVSLSANGFALRTRGFGPIEFAYLDGRIGHVSTPDVWRVRLSADGSRLVANVRNEETATLDGYAVNADDEFRLLRQWSVECQSEAALSACGSQHFLTYSKSRLHLRDITTGDLAGSARYPSSYILALASAPDGSRFASMGHGQLYLYAAANWSKPTTVEGFAPKLISMAYHPTLPVLATVQRSQTLVKYLDANTGKPLKKFAWKLGSMCAVAFSADGTLAAASAEDGRIVVWDADA